MKSYFLYASFLGAIFVAPSVTAAEENKLEGVIPDKFVKAACGYAKNDDRMSFQGVMAAVGLIESYTEESFNYSPRFFDIRCDHSSNPEGLTLLHYASMHNSLNTFEWLIFGLNGNYSIVMHKEEYKTILDWLDYLNNTSGTNARNDIVARYESMGAKRCAEIPECLGSPFAGTGIGMRNWKDSAN